MVMMMMMVMTMAIMTTMILKDKRAREGGGKERSGGHSGFQQPLERGLSQVGFPLPFHFRGSPHIMSAKPGGLSNPICPPLSAIVSIYIITTSYWAWLFLLNNIFQAYRYNNYLAVSTYKHLAGVAST